MKFIDLNPVEKENVIVFTCPLCGKHRIRLPKNTKWQILGKITDSDFTVTPSLSAEVDCFFHFSITNGEIK